jgi:hypothetical protein
MVEDISGLLSQFKHAPNIYKCRIYLLEKVVLNFPAWGGVVNISQYGIKEGGLGPLRFLIEAYFN